MFNISRYSNKIGATLVAALFFLPAQLAPAQPIEGPSIEHQIGSGYATFNLKYTLDSGEVLYGKFVDPSEDENVANWLVSVFDSQGNSVGNGYVDRRGEDLFFPDRTIEGVKCTAVEQGEFRVLDEIPPQITAKLKDNSLYPALEVTSESGLSIFEVYVDGELQEDRLREYIEGRAIPIIETDNSPHPIIEVIAEDRAHNRTVWRYRFTRRGVVDGNIEYDGISGEQVYERFGQIISETLNRIKQKYGFGSDVSVRDKPEGLDGSSLFYGAEIDSGCFILNGSEDGIAMLLHEVGHVKYKKRFNLRRNEDQIFEDLYRKVIELDIIDTFKDSNFITDPKAGHPRDNNGELFASAFMINELRLEEYQTRNFPNFTPEQRNLAEQIFDFVSQQNNIENDAENQDG